ncbi:Permease of the drug/metabolite transporter (DMT) superfamily [Halopseudomonas xinjiangensis]|uniref:Permease of the drug/metabolite transporter (DMT) superfamily n=1 Tax=Halopseudomonas xinjiangensis TaxID=487184 RepID=A0A1H1SVD9_9GAMM|nr:DMT family transporter [Halopseudomonas xinjiangensis]SDS52007.1 Permease of the drug/metabolite transporter (DMT) superfamily [Halopseudomonas xinjiangensis]
MSTIVPQLLLVLGASLWGLGWIPLHYFADQGWVGMPLVVVTYGLLAVVAIPVLWWERRAWRAQRGSLLVITFCGGWAAAALVTALAIGDVVRVMLLFYLAPVWGMLGAWLILGERLNPLRLMALLLAMLGVVLTLDLDADTFSSLEAADWLGLSAGLSFALNNLATRAGDQIPLASKTLACYIGSAMLAGFVCILFAQPIPPIDLQISWQIALLSLGWLLALGLVQYGLTHVEAGRAAVLIVCELVAAVLSSAWLGDRAISSAEWVGAMLITVAALIAGWPERELPDKPLTSPDPA